MIRATEVIGVHAADVTADDAIYLDFDARHRRRIIMVTDSGKEFLLDLPEAVAIADGDHLRLDDGTVVEVHAKAERVADITAPDAEHLVRIAWHLGNRHLPTQVIGKTLRIRDDHVIVAMVRGLGAEVKIHEATFHPEAGAYSHGH
jgi:urease accessory protein